MYKKKIINKINDNFDFNCSFDDLLNKAKRRNLKIEKNRFNSLIFSGCSFLLIISCLVLSINFINKTHNGSKKLILPGNIEFFDNIYKITDVIFINNDYSMEIVGYIIDLNDIQSFELMYPDYNYFAMKNINSELFNNRVPVYSISNYDVNCYLAVAMDSGLSYLYKSDIAEDIYL